MPSRCSSQLSYDPRRLSSESNGDLRFFKPALVPDELPSQAPHAGFEPAISRLTTERPLLTGPMRQKSARCTLALRAWAQIWTRWPLCHALRSGADDEQEATRPDSNRLAPDPQTGGSTTSPSCSTTSRWPDSNRQPLRW